MRATSPAIGELCEQQHDGHEEDHHDQLHEDAQHPGHLPGLGHRKEDSEDIEGQQRDDDARDHAVDDRLEIVHHPFEFHAVRIGHPQPEYEGQYQRRHDTEQGWHPNREIGCGGRCGRVGQQRRGAFEQCGEQRPPREVGAEAREKGEGIGQRRREGQQAPGVASQVGDARRHQPEDEQRDDERKELAENIIERKGDTRRPHREEKPRRPPRPMASTTRGSNPNLNFIRNGFCKGRKIFPF